MRSLRLLWGTVIGIAIIVCLGRPAPAQINYDLANFKAMADADSTETIAPGTKITLQNWQQYKKFMPIWMQAAFSGQIQVACGIGTGIHRRSGAHSPLSAVPAIC